MGLRTAAPGSLKMSQPRVPTLLPARWHRPSAPMDPQHPAVRGAARRAGLDVCTWLARRVQEQPPVTAPTWQARQVATNGSARRRIARP